MKRVIKANDELRLTDRQYKKAQELIRAYRVLYNVLDDEEFNEGGEYAPLLNYPDIAEEISDEMQYISSLEH